MEYEGQICRAPMERSAYKLPVMVGCRYNKCKFCDLFKHLKFRVIPIEEVREDIKRVYESGGRPRKIFLGDGSAFDLSTEHLLQVLDVIHSFFPDCFEINMNATVKGISYKSDEELKALADSGVRHLYIGVETGLEDVLAFMNKGNTVAELREQVLRIQKYGMCLDAHFMTGAAGMGRGEENAKATAAVLTDLHATSATNFSMFIHYLTPLYQDVLNGSFTPASEYESLIEEKRFIELICDALTKEGNHTMKYEGFHDFITFHVWGTLPRDGERIITKLDAAISEYENKQDIKAIIGPDSTFTIKSAY